ncbi:MAG: homoserine kinase [Thaumarchaeota archaeon]|nr:homoserine kinase [Nitrososphaerota archaeon]
MRRAASASASAPSTTANLGSGFDVFGMALDAFRDTVTVSASASRGVRVVADGGVPADARRNTAGLVALEAMRRAGARGLEVRITKRVPVGMGMGSSAASAAAAAVACDRLLSLGLRPAGLVELAGVGERASAGTVHYDNVAAAVLGGFVIVRTGPLDIVRMSPPRGMRCCVAVPEVSVPQKKTAASRAAVPRAPRLGAATANVANAAALVAGMARRDTALVGSAMADAIAEPARRAMVPGLESARRRAVRAGAAGVAISGAGPSILAVAEAGADIGAIGEAMRRALAAARVRCRIVECRPTARGAAGA